MASAGMASAVGTPADYSDALCRVYVEAGESDFIALDAITAFLVERSADHPAFHFVPEALRARDHGYELDLPMQSIPEGVRALAAAKVAVCQVRRLGPA